MTRQLKLCADRKRYATTSLGTTRDSFPVLIEATSALDGFRVDSESIRPLVDIDDFFQFDRRLKANCMATVDRTVFLNDIGMRWTELIRLQS